MNHVYVDLSFVLAVSFPMHTSEDRNNCLGLRLNVPIAIMTILEIVSGFTVTLNSTHIIYAQGH